MRQLNTLRGLAALMVLVSHYSNETQWLGAMLGRGAGQVGVQMFFLLSAFLMAHLYWTREPNAVNVRNYSVARVARVLPLFVTIVIASWVLCLAGQPYLYNVTNTSSLVQHLATLLGDQVLWTIPAELHFYAAFAVMWLLRNRLPYLPHVIKAVILVLMVVGQWPDAPKLMDGEWYFVRALPYFMAGMLIGIHYHARPVSGWFALLMLAPVLFYPLVLERVTGITIDQWKSPIELLGIAAMFAGVAVLVPANTPIACSRIGDWLGNISYSLYLLHYPILKLLKPYGLQGFIGVVILLAVSLALSTIVYRLYELPWRNLIRKRIRSPKSE